MLSFRSSDKDRLRALIGLDKTDNHMHNILDAAAAASTSNGAKTDSPNATELLALLQKQDQIISELYNELESCKVDLTAIKDESNSHFEQNQRVFDELRAQIVKSNLAKELVSGQMVSAPANGMSALSLPFQQRHGFNVCANCRESAEYATKLEKDKQKLQSRLLDNEAETSQLRRNEAENFRKVRDSVALVDQAVLEKNEVLLQLKNAQNRIENLERELKNALIGQQKSIDQCRKSTQERYEAEIAALKNQLNAIINDETDTKTRLATVAQERDVMVQEKSTAKEKAADRKREIDEKIKQLQVENVTLKKSNKDLEELYKENGKSLKMEIEELTQKLKHCEEQLNATRSNFESAKFSLNVTKKENCDLRERLDTCEKEAWHLRQWKQRLEKECEEMIKTKDVELKEAVRIAELKHEQTKMELERLLSSQNGLIFKLKEECKILGAQLERMAKNKRGSSLPRRIISVVDEQ